MCCFPFPTSLGNAASKPSTRTRVICTYCLDTNAARERKSSPAPRSVVSFLAHHLRRRSRPPHRAPSRVRSSISPFSRPRPRISPPECAIAIDRSSHERIGHRARAPTRDASPSPNARANDARKYASRTFTTLRDDRRREHHLTSRHARVAGQSRDRPHPFVPRDVVRSRASIDARERARASERASERIDRSVAHHDARVPRRAGVYVVG